MGEQSTRRHFLSRPDGSMTGLTTLMRHLRGIIVQLGVKTSVERAVASDIWEERVRVRACSGCAKSGNVENWLRTA